MVFALAKNKNEKKWNSERKGKLGGRGRREGNRIAQYAIRSDWCCQLVAQPKAAKGNAYAKE